MGGKTFFKVAIFAEQKYIRLIKNSSTTSETMIEFNQLLEKLEDKNKEIINQFLSSLNKNKEV
jgi:methanogenic corrinoid protein MtbC1